MLIVAEQPKYPRIHQKNGFEFQHYTSMACEISICSTEETSTRRISILQRRNFTRLIITMPCPGSRRKSKHLQKESENYTKASKTQLSNQRINHNRKNLITFVTCLSSLAIQKELSTPISFCSELIRLEHSSLGSMDLRRNDFGPGCLYNVARRNAFICWVSYEQPSNCTYSCRSRGEICPAGETSP